jgi:hypothetical protein
MNMLERISEWAKAIFSANGLRHTGNHELAAEDRAVLARSADDVKRGRFASDAQVRELFERNRRA